MSAWKKRETVTLSAWMQEPFETAMCGVTRQPSTSTVAESLEAESSTKPLVSSLSAGTRLRSDTKSSLLLDFWRGAQASRLCVSVCSWVPMGRTRAGGPVSTRPGRPCPLLLRCKVPFQTDIGTNLEKAFEPQISQKSTDYQGLAEFRALTLRVNCDEAKFDT